MPTQATLVRTLIHLLWIVWLLVWLVSARRVKPVRRQESMEMGLTYRVLLVASVVLLFFPDLGVPPLATRFYPRSLAMACFSVAVVAFGIAFSIWARVHIAENWSGRVTVKENHELVRSGPYHWIRHPIYTGILLALAGTVLAVDTWQAVLAFVLIVVSFIIKLLIEERMLTETFGDEYREYARETSRLIPGVW